MGPLRSVTFRGEEHDVEVDRDSGYEPDTGAHEIEWHFYGMSASEHDALNVTDDEEQAIYEQLVQASYDDLHDPDDPYRNEGPPIMTEWISQQHRRALELKDGAMMTGDDRARAAIRTLGLKGLKRAWVCMFARNRIVSDGHTWGCWRGLYYFIR